jgi:transglutaminase-like putative cysteine protease
VHENPFEKPEDLKDPERPTGTTAPKPHPIADRRSALHRSPEGQPAPDKPAPDKPAPDKPVADTPAPDKPSSAPPAAARWPAPATLHPVVASMPADAETTIASVARYIAERETDPAGRFRAAHDWVADRIAYDVPAYLDRRIPAQDAQSVFQRRIGVCAGYAQLLRALGREMGLEVEYVVGDARTSGTDERGESHAWTAVKLDGRHYLADATWNSGFPDGRSFKKSFRTDYLFTPPEVFGIDHFPNQERWQLRDKPISRGDFFRQAMMTPRFHAEGRELISPRRSQVTVSGPFTAEIKTPTGLFTTATWSPLSGDGRNRCQVENGPVTRVTCDLPGTGEYLVRLFSGRQQYGTFDYIGQIEANRE